jgi:hypothetical protein
VKSLKVGRSSQSRTIGCLSDIHNGSKLAVCSEEPEIGSGDYYRPNTVNKIFNEHWTDVRDWFGKINILSINGEPFNGANIKQNGDENWSSDMNDQLEDATKLLKVFRTKLYILTEGSGYHVRRDNTNYENMLAKRLNALSYNAYNLEEKFKIKRGQREVVDGANSRVDSFAFFKLNGRNINFAHHVGYSRRYYYRTTALTAEMAGLEFDRGYYLDADQNIDILGRGHVHYNVCVWYPSTIGFTTPCWKMPDRYLFRNGLSGSRPNVGAVKITIEQNGQIHYDKFLLKKKFPKPYAPDLTEVSKW